MVDAVKSPLFRGAVKAPAPNRSLPFRRSELFLGISAGSDQVAKLLPASMGRHKKKFRSHFSSLIILALISPLTVAVSIEVEVHLAAEISKIASTMVEMMSKVTERFINHSLWFYSKMTVLTSNVLHVSLLCQLLQLYPLLLQLRTKDTSK